MRVDKTLLKEAGAARRDLHLTIGLGFLAGLVVVGQAFCLSRIVNLVFLAEHTLAQVDHYLWILLALSLLRAAFTWGSQVSAQRVAGQVKTDLRARLTAHLLALGPAYTNRERSGELSNTMVEGVEALDSYFSQYLPQLAMAALIPLTILLVVFPLDITSGLILLLTAPLIPIFMVLIGSMAQELSQKQWVQLSRMSAHFLDVLQGLTTLKLLNRSREQIQVIRIISERFGRTTMKVLRVAFMSALVLESVATLSVAMVAVEIGIRLMYGMVEFEPAFFILILAPEFYLPLRLLGTRFHAAMSGATAARRIFEVLDTPLPPKPVAVQTRVPPLRDKIRLHHVGFTYPEAQSPALQDVSLTIPVGQTVALVGPSGAGKSTLAHLLLRFVEPGIGQIIVDGTPLQNLDMGDWRRQVAWVPQRPYLFNGTVLENIRLANPQADPDAVWAAAKQAFAHDFIAALPQGYNTPIGERGTRLSGGQAQRLALARAFLKDAPLLILDEATSNIDPAHEARIQAALELLMQGRTTLVIAHRLSTVYRADQIVVLEQGQVVETGTHAQLLTAPDGLYRRMVQAYGGAA